MRGQVISYVWRGSGSAIFLELGALRKNSNGKAQAGEITVSIEWSWRIENRNSIILGSWSEPDEINKVIDILKGHRIKKVSFFARLKELEIELENDIWLSSFATVEGDPEWSIKRNNRWLFFKKGRFVSEENT